MRSSKDLAKIVKEFYRVTAYDVIIHTFQRGEGELAPCASADANAQIFRHVARKDVM